MDLVQLIWFIGRLNVVPSSLRRIGMEKSRQYEELY